MLERLAVAPPMEVALAEAESHEILLSPVLDEVASARGETIAALAIATGQEGHVLGTGGRLSLVIHQGRVCVVDWFTTKQDKGCEVFLDERLGIIFPMPLRNPWADFSKSTIMLIDCLVRTRKVSKPYRDRLPKCAYQLYQVSQHMMNGDGLFGGPTSISADTCIVCKLADPMDPAFRCAFGLSSYRRRFF